VFCLTPAFLDAALRQYAFMIGGLRQVQRGLAARNVPFVLLFGPPEREIPAFVRKLSANVLITDFDPLMIKHRWKQMIKNAVNTPFYEVDARNIVPCWTASDKQEYAAYTIRPKIRRLLGEFLVAIPPVVTHPYSWSSGASGISWEQCMRALKVDRSVKPLEKPKPGEREAAGVLEHFLAVRIGKYHLWRNDPAEDAVSNLSPYLHFGQISAQRVALEVEKTNTAAEAKHDFLEELVVRRELADNFCYYNKLYDTPACFPDWAKHTLEVHRDDRREQLYELEQLEHAKTQDTLWNAAQAEMVVTGKMHGYLRMYWAKKLLQWTPHAEEAMRIAVYLNDKYELDGRDSNGYTGIAWALGGVHDRPWPERPVFGKVRSMSFNGCRKKFDVASYIRGVKEMVRGEK
jgi:deoxyribodipyrimidine photo-lyase